VSDVEVRHDSSPAARPGSFLRRLAEWADAPDLFTWFDSGAGSGMLRVEETTTEGEHVVRVEVPGIDPETDASVTVEGDVLHIHATRRQEEETESEGYRRSEFRYGSFTRALPLPAGVDPEAVTATYRDGILEVRVPRPPERPGAKGTIPITRG
jgi:HSP20 family protein